MSAETPWTATPNKGQVGGPYALTGLGHRRMVPF